MGAKNIYHEQVRKALVADGWTITDDPLVLKLNDRKLEVDLAAEHQPIGAEKSGRRIAVEIQSFIRYSPVADLQQAVGQYTVYRSALTRLEPDRTLYLAVSHSVHDGILKELVGRIVIEDAKIKLLVFDPKKEQVLKWIE